MQGRRTKGARKTPDMAATQRAIQAVELYTQGLNLTEIARQLGYADRSGVFYAIKKALDRHESFAVEELRQVHSERHLEVMRITREQWLSGGQMALWALDRYQRAQDAYSKLWGLDMSRDEVHAAMPYQKKIVLEDGPLQLPSPVVDEAASNEM